jgi:phosphate transport system protein
VRRSAVVSPAGQGRHPLDAELEELRESIVELGSVALLMVRRASSAVTADAASITSVGSIEDQPVAVLSQHVDERLRTYLARRQPVARDLRWVLADLRVTQELVRIAALAREIVTRTHRVYPHGIAEDLRALLELVGSQAIAELDLALEAFRSSELALARALEDMDSVMGDFQRELLRTLINDSSGRDVIVPLQLAFIARCFERIGDHAVAIADQVVFGQTGEHGTPEALDLDVLALGPFDSADGRD